MIADHPHTDPGDSRTECDTCGKWIFESTHSCKGVPVTLVAEARMLTRQARLRACPPCERGDHDDCTGWARRSRYDTCPCNARGHTP